MPLTIFFNASLISWDALVLGVILCFFCGMGFFWKRRKILSLVLALYLARLFLVLFPAPSFLDRLSLEFVTPSFLYFWTLFLVLSVIFISSRISLTISLKTKETAKARMKALKGMFYGLAAGGMFISLSLSLMDSAFQSTLSLVVSLAFLSPIAQIAWLLAPLILLIALK